MSRSPITVALSLLCSLLISCVGQNVGSSSQRDGGVQVVEALPASDQIAGWTVTGPVETYSTETLYDLVDGQADAYIAYGFRRVAVQSYEAADGTRMRVEIWDLGEASNAYGLFTWSVSGTPVAFGNDGDLDAGRRLAFWQAQYFVQVRASQPVTDGDLHAFAEVVLDALPTGGERPELASRLPAEGRMTANVLVFRREISIQDDLWLGGENLLGLNDETLGALAHYSRDGSSAVLIAILYPGPEQAEDAVRRLTDGAVDGFVAARTADTLLGAVFGEADLETANALLDRLFR